MLLLDLASIYVRSERYPEALESLKRAEANLTQSGRLATSAYATVLQERARTHLAMGAPALAEQDAQRAVELNRTRYGRNSPNSITGLTLLAKIHVAQGRLNEASRDMDRAFRLSRGHVANTLPVLDDKAQLSFMKNHQNESLRTALSLAFRGASTEDQRHRMASWLLNGKSVLEESLSERIVRARDNRSPESVKALRELGDIRREIARLQTTDGGADLKRMADLKDKEARLDTALATFDLRTKKDDAWYELDELRQRLPKDSSFIDVARVEVDDFKTPKSKLAPPARYLAFITLANGTVESVDLGEAAKIDDAVKLVRRQLETAGGTIAAKGEPAAEAALREPLAVLGKLALEPLLKHIGDKGHWIISPDADLWLVPWGILPLDDKTYAIEKHRIHYVVSGRDLLMNPLRLDRKTAAPMILADPDFDLGLAVAAVKEADLNRSISKDFKLGGVRRLPGTAIEAEAISPHLARFGGQPRVFTDKAATTAAFRSAKSPKVVVLSTHGFFLEDDKAAGKVAENPLLRCGLLLAGCNNASMAQPGQDNGVLTGLEIVGTDLRGTELVVLSACETGLGDIRNGEGVAGLRQAFQLAGAESVVATLWQVPDVQSAQLMVGFFDNLAKGQQRDEALRNAQMDQIQKRRAKNNAAHPFYWAAYTVTGQVK